MVKLRESLSSIVTEHNPVTADSVAVFSAINALFKSVITNLIVYPVKLILFWSAFLISNSMMLSMFL